MYKDMKEALKSDVAAVRAGHPDRGSSWRRHMHLGLCYVRGTPYRKCEADPDIDPDIELIQGMLEKYECVPEEDGERRPTGQTQLGAWLDKSPVPKPKRISRLYTVVRADLPPGAQAVQASHAMMEFSYVYPEISAEWHKTSNTVAILAVPGEGDLRELASRLRGYGIKLTEFLEPDLDNALTAVTFEPRSGGLLKRLPLALKDQIAQRELNPPSQG